MPLRYVDPNKKRGMRYRPWCASGVPAEPTHRPSHNFSWLYRATGGHITTQLWTVASAPLTTIGAKSGQPREVQLSYFHDGSDPILIASNYARPKTSRCSQPADCMRWNHERNRCPGSKI